MGRSDYAIRGGVKHDKSLIKTVEKWAEEGVTPLGMKHVKMLWEAALDGDKITERERATMRYILGKYDFEEAAKVFFTNVVDPPPSSEGYYTVIDGKHLQRELWDQAVKMTQDGILDLDEAKELWTLATKDGPKPTNCEVQTLHHVIDQFKASVKARNFMMENLAKQVLMVDLKVVVNHSEQFKDASDPMVVQIREDGTQTIMDLKQKISAVVNKPAENIKLEWMDKPVGKVHMTDDQVDEKKVQLGEFNIVYWAQKFPHFHIIASRLPETPISASEAIKIAVRHQAEMNAQK